MTKRLPVHSIDATGTRDGTTALHGDGTWKAPTTDPEVVRDTMAAALVAGSGVTITPDDAANTITVAATGGGGGSLTVQDENGNVATGVTQLDFQGAGVTASAGTGEVVVTIPSGGAAAAVSLRDTITSDFTTTTINSYVTVTGLSITITPTVAGVLMVNSRVGMFSSGSTPINLNTKAVLSPADASGRSQIRGRDDAGTNNAGQSFPLVGTWDLVASTAYTVTVQVYSNKTGTLTVYSDNSLTELSAVFIPVA